MKVYVLTAKSHPWLLQPIEDALKRADERMEKDVSKLARGICAPGDRPISGDEALLAFNALCDLGVLERHGPRYSLNRAQLDATGQLRKGIQAAVQVLGEEVANAAPEAQLCVSLPPSLSPAADHVIRESSMDLRSSLLDVAASAKQSLIFASPFWDAATSAEMVSLARKKLSAGVQVCLLGRFSRDLPTDVKTQLSRIADDPACSILSWFEGTGTETQTFHFKAISVDHGARGYMGSANMTFSSLRSRMELGVILTGNAATQLDRILRVVITMASPVGI